MTNKDNKKFGIITGITQGIGKVTAFEVAKTGMHLTLIARDKKRGDEVVAEIKKETGNKNIELAIVDLSSIKQIKAFASKYKKSHKQLHLLVNNAGAMFMERQESVDGYEMTFALNHLAYFVLTNELLPLLKKAQPSRIVNVSSMAHRSGHINFEDIMAKKKYSGFSVYGNSKLANVLFTYELAERLAKTKVTVNCLHPGVISTGFGKNNKGVVRSLISLAGRFMLTPEEGAKTTNYLALSPEVEGITGKYFDKCKAVKSNAESYQMAVAKKLWNVSEKLSK